MSTTDAYKAELASFLKAFGDNVRRVRLSKRISQETLSHHARLHRTEIGRIEQGAVEPRLSTAMILAHALGVTLEELLVGLPVPVERKPSANIRHWD